MTYGISLKSYFGEVKYTKAEKARNARFQSDIDSYERFHEHVNASSVEELQSDMQTLIEGYIGESFKRAFMAKKQLDAGNTVFGKTLDWSKFSYNQRIEAIEKGSEESFKDIFEDTRGE